MLTLAALLLLAAGAASAGEQGGAPGSMDALRERFFRITLRNAREFVSEQPDRESKADVALAIGALSEMGVLANGDPRIALEFFAMAADLGNPDGDASLGRLYAVGALGPDMTRAIEHFDRAVRRGSVTAMVQLGDLYANAPPGVTRDSRRALELYVEAAKYGETQALRRLEPVMAKAREWERLNSGMSAGFPTRREEIIDPDLERRHKNRGREVDLAIQTTRRELDRRVARDFKPER
jgi:TPR repeat protein